MLKPFHVLVALLALCGIANPLEAETLHVPRDYRTIQAAIDAAKPGDTVLVEPGSYPERLRLKERVTLRSAGDDSQGKLGLRRAEATILGGAGAAAKGPGVVMAEGSVLDGFTVTGVGVFDQKEYDLHHATFGELLPDERGAVGVKGSFPVLGIAGVTAVVKHSIVRNNGHAGIGCMGKGNKSWIYKNVVQRNMGGGIGIADGASPTVQENKCFNNLRGGIGNRNSSALILDNECFENVRAGIGIREGATPIVRGNKCYKNRRAGIGVRMQGTNPIIEDNECFENEMAGIGNRDGAAPVIRSNRCHKNQMAGIGSRDGAKGIIEQNECYENEMAGIGSRNGAAPSIRFNKCYKNKMAGIGAREGTMPIIQGNRCYKNELAGIGAREGDSCLIEGNECKENTFAGIGARDKAVVMLLHNKCLDNRLVAIGLRHGSIAYIMDNELSRSGGMPPIIAVREGSAALIAGNTIKGGGVAGILVDGTARIRGNRMEAGGKSGSAVWGWGKADLTVIGNSVDGYRNLLNSAGCKITVMDNVIRNFQGTAITVKNPLGSAIVAGNVAVSKNPKDKVLSFDGPQGSLRENIVKEPDNKEDRRPGDEKFWAILKKQVRIEVPERTGEETAQEGAWKLVVVHGKTTTYKLYHLASDPQEKKDLAAQMDNQVQRLRGRLEREEAARFKAIVRKEGAGK